MRLRTAFACISVSMMFLASSDPAQSAPIVIGSVTHANCFPFTCTLGGVSDRYQQVYAAANFSEPVEILGITFFGSAVFQTADYSFTFSTSNFTVNNLSSNLNNNPGADAALFASVNLSGPTGGQFTIVAGTGGGSSFLYDPSDGDLLVDIVLTNKVAATGSGFLHAMNGNAAGLFSRRHNFGSGFDNWGLVTGFDVQTVAVAVPAPATLFLFGLGLLGLGLVMRHRRIGLA